MVLDRDADRGPIGDVDRYGGDDGAADRELGCDPIQPQNEPPVRCQQFGRGAAMSARANRIITSVAGDNTALRRRMNAYFSISGGSRERRISPVLALIRLATAIDAMVSPTPRHASSSATEYDSTSISG